MSLQIWLPMTADLSNQGLYNSTITNNNVTLDASGKLGKCGYFNGSSYLKGTIDPSTWTEFSMAMWIKPPAASSGNKQIVAIGTSSGWNNIRAGVLYKTGAAEVICSISNGSTSTQYGFNMAVTASAWQHICVTYKNRTLSWYINGTLNKTLATTYDPIFTNYTTFGVGAASDGAEKFTGYLNDVRIYDEAIPPKLVKALSQGLVCHYPLNGNGRSGENLYDFEAVASKWANEMSSLINYTDSTYGNVIKAVNTSANQRIYRSVSNVWKSGQVYTVSFLAKASASGVTCDMSRSLADYSPTFTLTTEWKRYVGTITSTATADGGTLSFRTNTANSTVYLTQVKLELGDKVTPYMPGVGDSHYTSMGYNSTTEYDVSGYKNDMTKAGTLTYVTDTPRYSVATHSISGSYLMATQNSNTYLPTDSMTVNIWLKPTTWYTPFSCTEGGGWNIEETGSGLQFQCYISGVGYKPAKCSVTGSSLTDGKWHMLTGVFDRAAQQTKFYIDGELKATGSTGSSNGIGYVANRLIIGGEAQTTTPASSAYVGDLSDARIYATALSADDILELYNTVASVANNGTLLTRGEIVEQ